MLGCSHFPEEEIEAQWGKVTCPRSHTHICLALKPVCFTFMLSSLCRMSKGKALALGALNSQEKGGSSWPFTEGEQKCPGLLQGEDTIQRLSRPFLDIETHEKDFWAQQRK